MAQAILNNQCKQQIPGQLVDVPIQVSEKHKSVSPISTILDDVLECDATVAQAIGQYRLVRMHT